MSNVALEDDLLGALAQLPGTDFDARRADAVLARASAVLARRRRLLGRRPVRVALAHGRAAATFATVVLTLGFIGGVGAQVATLLRLGLGRVLWR